MGRENSLEQGWEVVFSYAWRQEVEEQFSFHKIELLIESLRFQR